MNSSKFEVSLKEMPFNVKKNISFKFNSYDEYKQRQRLFLQENNITISKTSGFLFNSEADYTFFLLKYS